MLRATLLVSAALLTSCRAAEREAVQNDAALTEMIAGDRESPVTNRIDRIEARLAVLEAVNKAKTAAPSNKLKPSIIRDMRIEAIEKRIDAADAAPNRR